MTSPSGISKEREKARRNEKRRVRLIEKIARLERQLVEDTVELEAEIDATVLAAYDAGAHYYEIGADLGHPSSWVIRHINRARERNKD